MQICQGVMEERHTLEFPVACRGGVYPTAYFLRSGSFMERSRRWDRMHFPAMPNGRTTL